MISSLRGDPLARITRPFKIACVVGSNIFYYMLRELREEMNNYRSCNLVDSLTD